MKNVLNYILTYTYENFLQTIIHNVQQNFDKTLELLKFHRQKLLMSRTTIVGKAFG